jgi:hypothetical protein
MKWTVLLGLALGAGAWAQPVRDADVAQVRSRYEYGQFSDVETVAQALLDRGGLSGAQLVEIHLYAGLAAFNDKAQALAERHFAALLRLEPDFKLDPYLAPPPAMKSFDSMRARMKAELDLLREERAASAQEAVDAEEQAKAQAREQEEARRAQLEQLTRQLTTARQASGKSVWVDLIPFGAGLFQQGRVGAGIGFAAAEAVLVAASLTTFFVYNGLFETQTLTVNNQDLGGNGQVQIVGIPRERQHAAEVLHWLNLASGIGAYVLYAGGVTEALLHHPPDEKSAPPQPPPRPSVSVGVAGAGAQLCVRF